MAIPGGEVIVFAGKQLGTLVAKKFGASVVERWTRHRASAFFAGFLQALSKELNERTELKDVDRHLSEILDDEKRSEVLFDAYRSVCFSRSKTMGPRIIGLLTGIIVLENRTSHDDEDHVFGAAELLSDFDLHQFFKCYRSHLAEVVQKKDRKKPHFEGNALVVPWSEDHRDSAWTSSSEIDTSPLNMEEALGPWASRLGQVGILTSRMIQRRVEYGEDGERHIDRDGVLETYAYSLVFQGSAKLLADLFERVLGASEPP